MFFVRKPFLCPLNEDIPLSTPIENLSFTIYDTETTGFQVAGQDRLIEIGAVQMKGHQVLEQKTFQTFVNPHRSIPPSITELTGIKDEQVQNAPNSIDAISNFFQFVDTHQSVALVGHYVQFDVMVLKQELKKEKYQLKKCKSIDTLDLIGFLSPSKEMKDLERYAMIFGTRIYERHSAIGDALTTAYLFSELLKLFIDRGCHTWEELLRKTENNIRNMSF